MERSPPTRLPPVQATHAAERSAFPGRWAPGGGKGRRTGEGVGLGSSPRRVTRARAGKRLSNSSARAERAGGWGARGAGHLETAGGRALIGLAAASAFQPGAPPPAPSTPEGISSSGGRYCCPVSLFGSDRVTIVSKLCPRGAPA